MSATIKPTAGRIVWFYQTIGHYNRNEHEAAMIACVHTDDVVSLSVCNRAGEWRSETSIDLVPSGGDPPCDRPFCTWMPYQIGQAAKTEDLQKQLDDKHADA